MRKGGRGEGLIQRGARREAGESRALPRTSSRRNLDLPGAPGGLQSGLEPRPAQVSSSLSLLFLGLALKSLFVREERWRGRATCRCNAISWTFACALDGPGTFGWDETVHPEASSRGSLRRGT